MWIEFTTHKQWVTRQTTLLSDDGKVRSVYFITCQTLFFNLNFVWSLSEDRIHFAVVMVSQTSLVKHYPVLRHLEKIEAGIAGLKSLSINAIGREIQK